MALVRVERRNRQEVIRGLLQRRAAHVREGSLSKRAAAAAPGAPADRRQRGQSVPQLRRFLREVDEQIFLELRHDRSLTLASAMSPTGAAAGQAPTARVVRALLYAAAVLLCLAGGLATQSDKGKVVHTADTSSAARPTPLAPQTDGHPDELTNGRAPDGSADATGADAAHAPSTSESVARPTGTPAAPLRTTPQAAIERVLAEASGPQFSPAFGADGTAVFFHTGRTSDAASALMVARVDDLAHLHVRRLLDDGARNYHAQPSPDGRLIAFDSDRDGERGVYVAERDGTHATRVSGTGYAAVPSWSKNGNALAFVRGEERRKNVWNLWLLSLATGEMRRLTHFRYGQTWGASWFADGRRLCYTHEDRIFILDLATGARRAYPTPVAGHIVRTPAVAPSGDLVAFQVYGSGVWLLDLKSGAMRQLLRDRSAEEFAWTADGKRLAFHSKRSGEWNIWAVTASTTQ
jgi:hypothetical protein